MKVENKDFWEDESIIKTQDQIAPKSADYEIYLYEKARTHFKGLRNLKAKIFGCGTGREIPEIINYVGIKKVVASDI